MTAVNVIDLEDYIKGVLYHEVSHKWPMDALMAQAVAARTYALYQKDQHQGKPYDYDLTSDIYSQVYGGKTSEHYRTGIAVDRTRGLVLMYQGKILPAYFHACCAGRTEDAHELWDIDIPPLKGVACPYCRTSPHYRWQRNFRLKDIQDALNKNGIKIGLIKGIAILEHDPSGRIRKLKITARDGKAVTVAGKDFRNWIGPNVIRSNNYEIVMQGYYMDLIGKGWGHGVGFCQWGAFTLASQGWDFRRILKYYYPQSEIVSADALP